jgi:hypothetical protein
MSDFQKPVMKKSVGSRGMREFPMVGGDEDMQEEFTQYGNPGDLDPFEISAEEEEALRRARKEKVNPPIAPKAKTRLEYLADIGKMTKDVTIGGITFTLRTLKAKEQRQVYLTLVDVTNKVDEIYNIKFNTLAHSLIKIDQQEIAVMVKVNSLMDKIKMLEDLEEIVTDQLYAAYQQLKTESDNQFSIKTDEDVKGVSEDLKK